MKVRVKFAKQGAMKFIGHLDIMRYFQKAVRRAGIDVAYSEGFSPHMIMSFAAPLGVGVTSTAEYFDMEIQTPMSSKEAVKRLNDTMAEGMEVLSFRNILAWKGKRSHGSGSSSGLSGDFPGKYGASGELERTCTDIYGTAGNPYCKKDKKE